MRPIDKLKPEDTISYTDSRGNKQTCLILEHYSDYSAAKMPLVGNIGNFCSYCEGSREPGDLSVEHIQAKSKDGSKTAWSNFLLSCGVCNSVKHDKKVVETCHFPHLNNTFLSFVYEDTGRVFVNPSIPLLSQKKAQRLLDLVKLQRFPNTEELPTTKDYRWRRRYENWNKANRYKNLYLEGTITVDDIIEEAKNRGNWSVWFTVFEGIDPVLERLITDFPGTSAACFDKDNHYCPIERNPGSEDPV